MSKKVELTNTNVRDWLNRIIKKIDEQFKENIGAYNYNLNDPNKQLAVNGLNLIDRLQAC